MKVSVHLVAALISLTGWSGFSGQGADAPSGQWKSFTILSNQVLSVSLKYMPSASLVNRDYLFVELENRTGKTLNVQQAWLGMPARRTDQRTLEVALTDVAGGIFFRGELPPGKTKANKLGTSEAGLNNLGLPPNEGYHVEITPNVEVMLTDGDLLLSDVTVFSSSNTDQTISFEFRYPSPDEMEVLISRFKELLEHPDDEFASGYYFSALAKVPDVQNSVTIEEVLFALESRGWSTGRGAVMEIAGKRFPEEPRVLSYFVDQLSRDSGDAFFSFPREVWQNPVFVEPLVKRYERNGDSSLELQQLRSVWITNQPIVARLSTALLKHHPTLTRDVAELSGADLCDWREAVDDAGAVGNTKFLEWLEPALDDRRILPDCVPQGSSQPRTRWEPRVCDCAARAMLTVLDGDWWLAFKKSGIEGWSTQEADYAAHDRIIADLKRRLSREKTSRPE